jgi:hypothetical protein
MSFRPKPLIKWTCSLMKVEKVINLDSLKTMNCSNDKHGIDSYVKTHVNQVS